MNTIFYFSGLENGTGIRSRSLEDAINIPNFIVLHNSGVDSIHKTNWNNIYINCRLKLMLN